MTRFSRPPRSVVVIMPPFLAAALLHVAELVGAGRDDLLALFDAAQHLGPLEAHVADRHNPALVLLTFLDVDDLYPFVIPQRRGWDHQSVFAPARDEPYLDGHLVLEVCA